MRHPDEGTLHAFIDGELPAAEASALEQHVAGCARCAVALAEARGLVAGASRVVMALDAAPASARRAGTSASPGVPAAAGRMRSRVFRAPFARAAALLLLAGGTAVVLDRAGAPDRRTIPLAESIAAEVAAPARVDSASVVIPAPAVASSPDRAATELTASARAPRLRTPVAGAVAPSIVAAPQSSGGIAAFTESSRGIAGGTATRPTSGVGSGAEVSDTVIRDSASQVRADRATAQARRRETATALALSSAEAPRPAPPPRPLPPASAPPPPPPPASRIAGAVVASEAADSRTTRTTRYRLENGIVLTLTEEPLRAGFVGEDAAGARAAAGRAAPAQPTIMTMNSYRWSDEKRGMSYSLTGPLSTVELESAARRLGQLERVP